MGWLLWRHAWSQLSSAQALVCQGALLDAAGHIYRGWHALASVEALRRGRPAPGLARVFEHLDARLTAPIWPLGLTPLSSALSTRYETSFNQVWQASLLEPDEAARFSGAPRGRRRDLDRAVRVQLAALERALRRQRWRLWAGHRLVGPLVRFRVPLALVALAALGLWAWSPWQSGERSSSRSLSATISARLQPAPAPMPSSPKKKVKLSRLSRRKAKGTHWNSAGNVIFGEQLTVTLPRVMRPKRIEVSLDNNDTYQFNFILKDREVGRLTFGPNMAEGGMVTYYDNLPSVVTAGGVDAVVISVTAGDPAHSVGHLLLFE